MKSTNQDFIDRLLSRDHPERNMEPRDVVDVMASFLEERSLQLKGSPRSTIDSINAAVLRHAMGKMVR